MNRYSLWKYAILVIAMLIGGLYALPNLFGESPAVQVSAAKASTALDLGTVTRVQEALTAAGVAPEVVSLEGSSIKARFTNTDAQLKAKGAIEKALNPDAADPTYVVDDVVHYCVTNMPGAVGRTSTYALCNATLPYVIDLAIRGVAAAARESAAIRSAVNVYEGRLVLPAVAAAFGLPCEPLKL
jgi:alanine dehydrogenase